MASPLFTDDYMRQLNASDSALQEPTMRDIPIPLGSIELPSQYRLGIRNEGIHASEELRIVDVAGGRAILVPSGTRTCGEISLPMPRDFHAVKRFIRLGVRAGVLLVDEDGPVTLEAVVSVLGKQEPTTMIPNEEARLTDEPGGSWYTFEIPVPKVHPGDVVYLSIRTNKANRTDGENVLIYGARVSYPSSIVNFRKGDR